MAPQKYGIPTFQARFTSKLVAKLIRCIHTHLVFVALAIPVGRGFIKAVPILVIFGCMVRGGFGSRSGASSIQGF